MIIIHNKIKLYYKYQNPRNFIKNLMFFVSYFRQDFLYKDIYIISVIEICNVEITFWSHGIKLKKEIYFCQPVQFISVSSPSSVRHSMNRRVTSCRHMNPPLFSLPNVNYIWRADIYMRGYCNFRGWLHKFRPAKNTVVNATSAISTRCAQTAVRMQMINYYAVLFYGTDALPPQKREISKWRVMLADCARIRDSFLF